MRRKEPPRSLNGKVALVTGAGRGVGKATAIALAAKGARVALIDLDGELAESAAGEIGHGIAIGITLDVTDHTAFAEAMDEVEERLGPIEILVNNAGIMPIGHFENESDELAERIFAVNLHAPLWSTKEMIRRLKANHLHGHIVNVASGVGWIAAGGGATYSSSKFAIVGLSHALSLELHGTGIDISVVGPSFIDTELSTGLAALKGFRKVSPEEVGDAIVDGLEYPRFAIWVPKAMGAMALTLSAIPYGIRDALARKQNVDKLLLEADQSARVDYESRARGGVRAET